MVLGTVSATNAASQQLRLDYITTKPLQQPTMFSLCVICLERSNIGLLTQDVLLTTASAECFCISNGYSL